MHGRGRRRAVAAALALAVAAALAPATPTSAAVPTVRCSDLTANSGGAVRWQRIDADLLVDDETCYLVDVGVHGDVTIPPGGRLGISRTSIHGDIASSGVLSTSASTVDGDITTSWPSDAPGYVDLEETNVKGGLSGSSGAYALYGTSVAGPVDVTATYFVSVVHAHLGASLTVRAENDIDVAWSTVTGDLTLAGPTTHSLGLCTSTVGGDLSVSGSGSGSATDPGSGHSPGPGSGSASAGTVRLAVDQYQVRCSSTVAGSVHLTGNDGDVTIGRLFVKGDLTCTGNTGPAGVVVLRTASIRGTRSGQCA
ncbi:hypothetical protein CCE01nite_17930 [Cellulomonas cellasea]|uniref:Adhesin domain-containing protein n=1 Tax=Cellulomonas cellasea TaxID=43670 RepID=A0A4Y3KWN2_9CELL|nr:hypothetical protein CCE01nite_17930 [Cellulomonas cellasea]